MHYNQYNNIPMGIGAVLARNPEARRNFALASQEEQTASHIAILMKICVTL